MPILDDDEMYGPLPTLPIVPSGQPATTVPPVIATPPTPSTPQTATPVVPTVLAMAATIPVAASRVYGRTVDSLTKLGGIVWHTGEKLPKDRSSYHTDDAPDKLVPVNCWTCVYFPDDRSTHYLIRSHGEAYSQPAPKFLRRHLAAVDPATNQPFRKMSSVGDVLNKSLGTVPGTDNYPMAYYPTTLAIDIIKTKEADTKRKARKASASASAVPVSAPVPVPVPAPVPVAAPPAPAPIPVPPPAPVPTPTPPTVPAVPATKKTRSNHKRKRADTATTPPPSDSAISDIESLLHASAKKAVKHNEGDTPASPPVVASPPPPAPVAPPQPQPMVIDTPPAPTTVAPAPSVPAPLPTPVQPTAPSAPIVPIVSPSSLPPVDQLAPSPPKGVEQHVMTGVELIDYSFGFDTAGPIDQESDFSNLVNVEMITNEYDGEYGNCQSLLPQAAPIYRDMPDDTKLGLLEWIEILANRNDPCVQHLLEQQSVHSFNSPNWTKADVVRALNEETLTAAHALATGYFMAFCHLPINDTLMQRKQTQ